MCLPNLEHLPVLVVTTVATTITTTTPIPHPLRQNNLNAPPLSLQAPLHPPTPRPALGLPPAHHLHLHLGPAQRPDPREPGRQHADDPLIGPAAGQRHPQAPERPGQRVAHAPPRPHARRRAQVPRPQVDAHVPDAAPLPREELLGERRVRRRQPRREEVGEDELVVGEGDPAALEVHLAAGPQERRGQTRHGPVRVEHLAFVILGIPIRGASTEYAPRVPLDHGVSRRQRGAA
ncbi:hypothetical protein S7711_07620 [Stachybotrys chartarum IBT 7711]|uniref:Uncharacterized protein n=1 Tax=Stachybotrys chartarum (strain CBS 109288 / IBT 7711) TaxID=1280523 RepID=A0A084BCI8_STACB|nr:hypothetical protein S7711_07620 [Stachybotrys chartarum IBT 7711]